jgi:hypothetical protein
VIGEPEDTTPSIDGYRAGDTKGRSPLWVKSGKAHSEQMTSALHPIADLTAYVLGRPLSANCRLMHRSESVIKIDH